MRTLQLAVTQGTFLNASGNGSISLGPSWNGEEWDVTSSSINNSDSSTLPQIKLAYNGGSVQIDASKLGGFNTSGIPYNLKAGQFVTATWTGGVANSFVSLSLTGTKILP